MPEFIRIHKDDHVAVALTAVPAGTVFAGVTAAREIPQGHKMALRAIAPGENVCKYGFPIGHATQAIAPGDWVHTHNMATNLSGTENYTYCPSVVHPEKRPPAVFLGYRRKDGKVGIRNEIWIIPTVGCVNEAVFHKAVAMIDGFKDYFLRHGEVVYENPSPGNKAGGITTLEEKSCGCVQKGGSAPIADVIGYGEQVCTKGLTMLCGPGNDLVSATALTAAGAHLILFTTGRGTPFGAPAPTMKLATNTPLAQKKAGWIDFNAGTVADGSCTLVQSARELMEAVLRVASGELTRAEEKGFREISIFKEGVVL